VLIEGETGTGKEMVARAIHAGRGPFLAINVAAIPDELAESELFGHQSGSFTGATGERRGLLLEASGGTLFLDEVNAMSLPLQAKLLRVIQDKAVRPVGANRELAVDFRLVCATNEDLERLVSDGRFRRDLYHRINVLTVRLPPLRERRGDIPRLAEEFLHKYARAHGRNARRFAPALLEALGRRDWPGNVRELENEIEQRVVMAPEGATEIGADPVAAPAQPGAPAPEAAPSQPRTLAEMEARYIREVMAAVGGNKSRAARILGIDYKTLLRKVGAGG
jgi:transcriptional regulator with PAS, ATPase and Fis domain